MSSQIINTWNKLTPEPLCTMALHCLELPMHSFAFLFVWLTVKLCLWSFQQRDADAVSYHRLLDNCRCHTLPLQMQYWKWLKNEMWGNTATTNRCGFWVKMSHWHYQVLTGTPETGLSCPRWWWLYMCTDLWAHTFVLCCCNCCCCCCMPQLTTQWPSFHLEIKKRWKCTKRHGYLNGRRTLY